MLEVGYKCDPELPSGHSKEGKWSALIRCLDSTRHKQINCPEAQAFLDLRLEGNFSCGSR